MSNVANVSHSFKMNSTSCIHPYGSLTVFVVGLLLSSTVTFINGFAIFILFKAKNLVIQIRTIVLHLAITDTFLGLIIVVFSISNLNCMSIPEYLFVAATRNFAVTSYIFTMILALERLISVGYPNYYVLHVTYEKIRNACICTWISTFIGLILSVLSNYGKNKDLIQNISDVIVLSVYILTVSVLSISSVQLYRSAEAQIQKINIFQRPTSRKFICQTYKKTTTALIICGLMLVCTFPGFVMSLIKLIDKDTFNAVEHILNYPFKILAYLNHCLNPFLYIFRFKECRRKVDIYYLRCKKNN